MSAFSRRAAVPFAFSPSHALFFSRIPLAVEAMTTTCDRADQLAARAAAKLGLALLILVLVRGAVDGPPEAPTVAVHPAAQTTPQAAPRARAVAWQRPVQQWTATPAPAQLVRPKPAWALELEAERAKAPSPLGADSGPRHIELLVSRERWSRAVEVPEGRQASVTFSIGRMRIERNGTDTGVWYRRPAVEAGGRNGEVVASIKLFPAASLDRSPRTIKFDASTRKLRFLSLEQNPENVVVEIF